MSSSASPAGTRPRRALVAEDNAVNQMLIARVLELRGVVAVIVENGEEAVSRTASESFDFVLMDIQMPVMSGLEATRLIRERERESGLHVPIIAVTTDCGQRDRYLLAGMDGYVEKPIRKENLFAEIDRVLAALGSSQGAAGPPEDSTG